MIIINIMKLKYIIHFNTNTNELGTHSHSKHDHCLHQLIFL